MKTTGITSEELLLAMEGIPDDLLERSEAMTGTRTAAKKARRTGRLQTGRFLRYFVPAAAALLLLVLAARLRTLRMGSSGTGSAADSAAPSAYEEIAEEAKDAGEDLAVTASGTYEEAYAAAEEAAEKEPAEENVAAAETADHADTVSAGEERSFAESVQEGVRKIMDTLREIVRKASGRETEGPGTEE